jgi:hypothetical protein
MEELVQRLANSSNMQNVESVNSEERIFFIYKNYIVSIFKLVPINEDNESIGSFENVYVVYDIDNDEIFNESNTKYSELFKELPPIDNAQFYCDFSKANEIEMAKRKVRQAVSKYLEDKTLSSQYIEGLMTIYGYIDESTKELIKFFIDNSNK